MKDSVNRIVEKIKSYCLTEFPNDDTFYFMVDKIEEIINDILREENYLEIIKEVYSKLNSEERRTFLTFINSSNLEIFNDWFYSCIKTSMDGKDVDSYFAKDLYKMYKGHWEKIERRLGKY